MDNHRIDGYEYTRLSVWVRFKQAMAEKYGCDAVEARIYWDSLENSCSIHSQVRTTEQWRAFEDRLFMLTQVSWPEGVERVL